MRRGFTLVECLIATFLLLMGFLAVASTYPMSYRASIGDRNRTLALAFGQNILNQVRTQRYGMTLPPFVTAPFVQDELVEGNVVETRFTPSIQFDRGGTRASNNPSADICIVTVVWQEKDAPHKQVQICGGVYRDY